MGYILKRKDKTSIFCPKLKTNHNPITHKVRFIEIITLISIIALVTWIVILTK